MDLLKEVPVGLRSLRLAYVSILGPNEGTENILIVLEHARRPSRRTFIRYSHERYQAAKGTSAARSPRGIGHISNSLFLDLRSDGIQGQHPSWRGR